MLRYTVAFLATAALGCVDFDDGDFDAHGDGLDVGTAPDRGAAVAAPGPGLALAAADDPDEDCIRVRFERDVLGGLAAGDEPSELRPGLTVACENGGGGPDLCMIFDSDLPTGGDLDLGTPNIDFGGLGEGAGGGAGQPGANTTPLDHILIISEDGDASDPDDEAGGGAFRFTFAEPARVVSVAVVDIDSDERGAAAVTCSGPALPPVETEIPPLGDNSVQTVDIGRDGVKELEVRIPSSGALAEVEYCVTEPRPPGPT